MATLTASRLNTVIGQDEPPVFSLYMPTHRRHPDNATDSGVFRQLVRQVEVGKGECPHGADVQAVFANVEALADDFHFGQHTWEGLAVVATRRSFDVYRLRRPVRPLAVASDSTHVKPLLKYLQSSDRYHV